MATHSEGGWAGPEILGPGGWSSFSGVAWAVLVVAEPKQVNNPHGFTAIIGPAFSSLSCLRPSFCPHHLRVAPAPTLGAATVLQV